MQQHRRLLWLCLLKLLGAARAYTVFDDASWAVTHDTLLDDILGANKQALYDDYIRGCDEAIESTGKSSTRSGCAAQDRHRLKMNSLQPSSVYNYTKHGFLKRKAPKELFDIIKEFYLEHRSKAEIEWKAINTYHNMWEVPPTIIHLNLPRTGGSSALQTKIWDMTRDIMEEWTGQMLSPVSLYGVRLYHNNSILAPHVDRMPLVTSCIINVDQDVEEDWPLEVYGHDGNAVNVTMVPGDMVLYESHSVVHGRPFPLKGNYYANVFIHFEPIDPIPGMPEPEADIPPYVIPGSVWEKEYVKSNPRGWKKSYNDPWLAAQKGDVRILKRLGLVNSTKLDEKDKAGWAPLHEAVRAGHFECVEYLVASGSDINHVTHQKYSPLHIARDSLVDGHPITKLLESVGATDIGPEDSEL